MQDIIDRAVEAEAKLLAVPFTGHIMAAGSWAAAVQAATTEELLAEAAQFDSTDKHYPLRAQLQFARLAKARREGR